MKQGPLERSEYIESKRSNIDRSSQDGLAKRHLVYDEYQKYHKWKRGEERLDKEDVILELIRNKKRLLSKKNPLFDAVYLDVSSFVKLLSITPPFAYCISGWLFCA